MTESSTANSRMAWDPETYMAFADMRSRPGLELIARIPYPSVEVISPEVIVDLGCGPGHLTAVLARRWPEARVIGVDSSAQMLARAESQFPAQQWPSIEWQHRDIAAWTSEHPVSILFSNAALHWLGGHDILFPRLMALVSPGGVLAVQMPDNWDHPSHRLIGRLVADPRWKTRTAPVFLDHPLAEPEEYRAWLLPQSAAIDQWRTTYYHVLEGADPVLAWVKGSVLRPILAVLEPDESQEFLTELTESYRTNLPPEPSGVTMLPFSRVFMVATRL
jgi:trans-aconitate 2-methyltransferase